MLLSSKETERSLVPSSKYYYADAANIGIVARLEWGHETSLHIYITTFRCSTCCFFTDKGRGQEECPSVAIDVVIMPFEIFSILNFLFGSLAAVSLMYHSTKVIKTTRQLAYIGIAACCGAIAVTYAMVLLDLMPKEHLPYVLRPMLTLMFIPLMVLPYTSSDKQVRERIAKLEARAAQNDEIIKRLLQGMPAPVKENVTEIIVDADSKNMPRIPLLVICGDDSFCEEDRDRINQTGIPFRMLKNATKSTISKEFQRRRMDGTMYWWVHISAHGSREGIMLTDGMAEPRFWNRTLSGVRIVFLASCDGPEVGDLIIGVARMVIVFYGDMASSTAAMFTLSFWRARLGLTNSEDAYDVALEEVPEARPFVDMRRR